MEWQNVNPLEKNSGEHIPSPQLSLTALEAPKQVVLDA